jgi:oligopeptide transport system substrate-binding protein
MSKKNRFYLLFVLVLVAAMAFPTFGSTVAQGEKVLNVAFGAGDIPTIDPSISTDTTSVQVSIMTHFPLVRSNELNPSEYFPGLAESWSLSENGLVWTFKIRAGIPWVKWDGSAVVELKDANGKVMTVTAKDVEYAVKRLLDPRTASDYAYVTVDSLKVKGAGDFNSFKAPEGKDFNDPAVVEQLNKLRDAVAVKAVDDATLTVETTEKVGFALGIFGMWQWVGLPQAIIEEFGDKWTEPGNAASYGPFVVSEWKHDESLTMVKNPFWKGIENSPAPALDKLYFRFLDTSPAFSEYEAGNMDTVGVPLTELDRVKADPVLSKELFIGPNFCTYYYGYNVTKAPFDDARVRRAFSMAFDRQDLVENVTKGGQIPARWFSRPGLAAAPTPEDSPTLGIGYDPEGAKAELDAYLKEKGLTVDQLPPITLMVNQVEGHIKIAEAAQAMWKETLGVEVQLTTQEWKVFLKTLNEDPPQMWRLGWCQDYSDADNFLKGVFRSNSGNNHTMWKNETFDALVDQAGAETDNAKRLELYRQAEELLVKTDAVMIPIYWYTTVSVTKPNVVRTYSLTGHEYYEKWDKK